ncbi:MAG: TRAP transporter small permease, partial [Candidatus Ventricola sp.]
MNALKKVLTPVSDALDKLCSVLIVIMLGVMVLVTGAQIVCRTWFTALSWSDEVTRYLLIWSTFLGASVVYRHSG